MFFLLKHKKKDEDNSFSYTVVFIVYDAAQSSPGQLVFIINLLEYPIGDGPSSRIISKDSKQL